MIQAVFLDYTGTMVQERGREMEEVVARICQNSDLSGPREVLTLWWTRLRAYEEASYLDTYQTEDQIVDRLLEEFSAEFHLREDLQDLHQQIRRFWIYAPPFPDVKEFFKRCSRPIYVISNNGMQYIEKGMEDKGLSPAGIVCADMVRAYKPHRELFEKALEVSGCGPEQVIHVGDSYRSDVAGARSAGIRPILLQRDGGAAPDDTVTAVHSLDQVLESVLKLSK